MSATTEYRKKNHLCVTCGAQDERTLAGLYLCGRCNKIASENALYRMKKRVKAKTCIFCGTQDERTLSGMRECAKCAKKHSERNKKQYNERKAQHKCVRCGKDLPDGYSIFECESCRKKRKAWMWGAYE